MTHIDANAASTLLTQLAIPAARAILLATAGGLALAVFRVKTTSLLLFAWTGVLYAALAMPLLGRMLPPLPIPVPAFLAPSSAQPVSQRSPTVSSAAQPLYEDVSIARGETVEQRSGPDVVENISVPSVKGPALATTDVATPYPGTPARTSFWTSIQWSLIATAIYVAMTLLLLARLVVGIVFSRRLARSARTIREQRVVQCLASRAYASGLDTVPRAAESELISVPVTVGAFRSTILLPASWREWDNATLDAVIAHEVSHVARGDALTQRLSLLHRAIFWFSPLAWWLDRHLADLAELASDEAALSCGTDRNEYAKTLLGFFEALQTAPGRVWWQGVSMAKAGQAEQRVERILAWKEARGAVTMGLKKSISVAIIAIALPAVYVAASVRPTSHDLSAQNSQTPPSAVASSPKPSAAIAPPAQSDVAPISSDEGAPEAAPSTEPDAPSEPTPEVPAPSPAPVVALTPPAAAASPSGVPTPAPRAAMAPVAPFSTAAPRAAWSGQSPASNYSVGRGYSYAYGYDDDQRFVIVSGKSDSLTMSGSSEDARHVEKLKKAIPGDFIWFERDEKSYVIRDQATIDRARKLWAPQEELGKKQEALGKQQEALGKQQEELGAKMEQIRVQIPDMSVELDRLKAKLQKLGSSATMEQIGDLQSEIGELQSKIGEIQSHAGDQQSKLGDEMGVLGAQQGKLGEQQGELGRQQGELARQASREMRKILDEALKNGTAQPEPQSGGMASL